eukprot:2432042-Amphidinium_carterae.1
MQSILVSCIWVLADIKHHANGYDILVENREQEVATPRPLWTMDLELTDHDAGDDDSPSHPTT